MPLLVVFDLDGTLVDSRQDLADSTNDVLASLGAPPLPVDQVVRMVGDGARTLIRRALEATACETSLDRALEAFHRAYAVRLLHTTRPYPGIEVVLRDTAALATLAVLTNKPLAPTERLLDEFGWRVVFGKVLGGDSAVPRKPDPAGLLSLMDWAGATAASTLLVGDSMVDIETARCAGVSICVAAYGFGNARGDLALRGDELVAHTAGAVGTSIGEWAQRAERAR